ncbi:hypothetical protein MLD38_032917 [Melastoma candidum]|uniref:Uncharacterized protein n=1 Tax=Melastoma candidum TaxID=119954 RepID=A0ACB9M7M6_9MYRT|nr:hypothetical protein MLD38_032917 [Melastoma candidum]
MRALIFVPFNENMKWGPSTEHHFRLLYRNGSKVYDVDHRGRTKVSAYGPLSSPKNNNAYKGKYWCAAADSARNNETALRLAVTTALRSQQKNYDGTSRRAGRVADRVACASGELPCA